MQQAAQWARDQLKLNWIALEGHAFSFDEEVSSLPELQ